MQTLAKRLWCLASQGLLEVLRTRRLTDEFELPVEVERVWLLRDAIGGAEVYACNSSTFPRLGWSPRRGERNSELGIVRSLEGEPNVKLVGIGGRVGRAGTLGGVRGEGDALAPDATEPRLDTLNPGVVGDGCGDRRRRREEMGVEDWAASGSRVKLAMDGRRRAIRREPEGGGEPSFLVALSSPWRDCSS